MAPPCARRCVAGLKVCYRSASRSPECASRLSVIASRRDYGHWITPGYLRATRFANRFLDGIVTNAPQVREFTQRVEGVPRERIEVIYNGVDVEALRRAGGGFHVPFDDRQAQAGCHLARQFGLAGARFALHQQRALEHDGGIDGDLEVRRRDVAISAFKPAHEKPAP